MDPVIKPLEKMAKALPGGKSPIVRTLYGAALGAAIVYAIKPTFAWDPSLNGGKGGWRPFAPTAPPGTANPTYFPYWAVIGLTGALFGVFI